MHKNPKTNQTWASLFGLNIAVSILKLNQGRVYPILRPSSQGGLGFRDKGWEEGRSVCRAVVGPLHLCPDLSTYSTWDCRACETLHCVSVLVSRTLHGPHHEDAAAPHTLCPQRLQLWLWGQKEVLTPAQCGMHLPSRLQGPALPAVGLFLLSATSHNWKFVFNYDLSSIILDGIHYTDMANKHYSQWQQFGCWITRETLKGKCGTSNRFINTYTYMYICALCMYICVYIHLYTYMCYIYDLCAIYVLYMIWHVCVYI